MLTPTSTEPSGPAVARPTTAGMRKMLFAASVLVFLMGLELFFGAAYTSQWFAWTVVPACSAAFLGANYLGACVLEFLAAREKEWARARVAVPGVLVFTAMTNLPTWQNLRHMHWRHFNTWTWFLVYGIVPVVMGLLLIRQLRVPGRDPDDGPRSSPVLRLVFGVHALIGLGLGAALCTELPQVVDLWPWNLSARGTTQYGAGGSGMATYVGVWMLGMGIVAAQVCGEPFVRRCRAAFPSLALLAALQWVVLLRFHTHMDWTNRRMVVYAVYITFLLLSGLAGWWIQRTAASRTGTEAA